MNEISIGDKIIHCEGWWRGSYQIGRVTRIGKTIGLETLDHFYLGDRAHPDTIQPYDDTLWGKLCELGRQAENLEAQVRGLRERQRTLWRKEEE